MAISAYSVLQCSQKLTTDLCMIVSVLRSLRYILKSALLFRHRPQNTPPSPPTLCLRIYCCIPLVKCRKIAEVTLGTLDIKSRPMRCQKGLRLQLMYCTPFRLLSQDFRTRKMEYRRLEYQSKDQSCSWSKT